MTALPRWKAERPGSGARRLAEAFAKKFDGPLKKLTGRVVDVARALNTLREAPPGEAVDGDVGG